MSSLAPLKKPLALRELNVNFLLVPSSEKRQGAASPSSPHFISPRRDERSASSASKAFPHTGDETSTPPNHPPDQRSPFYPVLRGKQEEWESFLRLLFRTSLQDFHHACPTWELRTSCTTFLTKVAVSRKHHLLQAMDLSSSARPDGQPTPLAAELSKLPSSYSGLMGREVRWHQGWSPSPGS